MDWEVPLALHCNVCSSLSIQKEPIYDSYKCVCNPHWINELCVACAECNAFTVFVGVWRHLLVRRWCNVDHFWFRGIHVAFNLKMIIHQCIQQFECALVSVKSVIKLTQLKVSREKRVSGLRHCPCMRSIAGSWKRISIILTSWHHPSCYRSRNQCGVLRLACGNDNPSVVVERQKAWSHDHSFPEGSQLLGPPGVSAAFLLPRKRQMPVWPPLSQSVYGCRNSRM